MCAFVAVVLLMIVVFPVPVFASVVFPVPLADALALPVSTIVVAVVVGVADAEA